MLNLSDLQTFYSSNKTVGQELKEMSDDLMQETWDNNIQSRTCYLYDYSHDDNQEINTGYNPSTNVNKKALSCKFIITQYKTQTKLIPEYHIQFSPNDWNNNLILPDYITQDTELMKIGIEFPVGLYIDIPDDKGVYYKWLIIYMETANQFPKFGVLKCNYYFNWVTYLGSQKYLRNMWGVQTSTNSGTGIKDNSITVEVDGRRTIYLPYNAISSELTYDKRLIVSTPMTIPITYKISDVINTDPMGINQFTLSKDKYNSQKDFVGSLNEEGKLIDKYGRTLMYANYYDTTVTNIDTPTTDANVVKLNCSYSNIKVKGSARTVTASYYENNIDKTNETIFSWEISCENKVFDLTNDANLIVNFVDAKQQTLNLKFIEDKNYNGITYYGKVLNVKCTVGTSTSTFQFEIVGL